jgi:hypothetical protein
MDRETYVHIDSANVCQNCCPDGNGNLGPCNYNFDIVPGSTHYGPYDFDSVMHYGQCDFSTNPNCPSAGGQTITVLPPNQAKQTQIGQRDHLSYFDKMVMRGLYSYANDRYWDLLGLFGDGTFLNPWGFPDVLSFQDAVGATPQGGTLFLLRPASYPAVGTYGADGTAITIIAPQGATLGK